MAEYSDGTRHAGTAQAVVTDDAAARRFEELLDLARAAVERVKHLPEYEVATMTFSAPGDYTAIELTCQRINGGFEMSCGFFDPDSRKNEYFSSAAWLDPWVDEVPPEFTESAEEAANKLARAGQNAWARAHAYGLMAGDGSDQLRMRVADWVMDEGDGLVTRREAMAIAAEGLEEDPQGLSGMLNEAACRFWELADEVKTHEGAPWQEAAYGRSTDRALHRLATEAVEAADYDIEDMVATRTYKAPGDLTDIKLTCTRVGETFETSCAFYDPDARSDVPFTTLPSRDARGAALRLAQAGQAAWTEAHARGLMAAGPCDRLCMRLVDWVRRDSQKHLTRRKAMAIAAEGLANDPQGLAGMISSSARELEDLAEEVERHGDGGHQDASGDAPASVRDELEACRESVDASRDSALEQER